MKHEVMLTCVTSSRTLRTLCFGHFLVTVYSWFVAEFTEPTVVQLTSLCSCDLCVGCTLLFYLLASFVS